MSRTSNVSKRQQLLKSKRDPFYNSLWLSKFSNYFMKDGKKFIVEKSFFKGFSVFKQRNKWSYPTNRSHFMDIYDLKRTEVSRLNSLHQELGRSIYIKSKLLEQMNLVQKFNINEKKKENYLVNLESSRFLTKIIVRQPIYILLRSFIKNKPLFALVSKRLGKVIKQIPTPLSPYRQLIVALRLCAKNMNLLSRGHLWQRLYYYLLNCLKNGKKIREKERSANVRMLVSLRTNLRFRWI